MDLQVARNQHILRHHIPHLHNHRLNQGSMDRFQENESSWSCEGLLMVRGSLDWSIFWVIFIICIVLYFIKKLTNVENLFLLIFLHFKKPSNQIKFYTFIFFYWTDHFRPVFGGFEMAWAVRFGVGLGSHEKMSTKKC